MEELKLDHYVQAQENWQARAEGEMSNGMKTSHWIWFIFPMLKGLGHSQMCEQYDLLTLSHAIAFLEHDTLRANYISIVSIVHKQLCEKKAKVAVLMGSSVDVLKLISSLTLFSIAIDRMLQNGDDGGTKLYRELMTFSAQIVEPLLQELERCKMSRCQFTISQCS
jgi:uncharacterized protein (DUF1810 family)